MAIFWREPHWMKVGQAKIANFNEYLAIRSMTAAARTTTVTVDHAVYCTDRQASVNLVYHKLQHGRPWRRKHNGTEHYLFVCSSKSEAEVTNNSRLHSTYCTNKATDRHEALCDLSATARLLVPYKLEANALQKMWHRTYADETFCYNCLQSIAN